MDDDLEAWADLTGNNRRRVPGEGLRSRCSRCGMPSVTNQKGYQRCELHWALDQDDIERDLAH